MNTSLAAVGAAVSAGKPFFLHLAPTGPRAPSPDEGGAGELRRARNPRRDAGGGAGDDDAAAGGAVGGGRRSYGGQRVEPRAMAETFAGNMWVDDALGAVLGGLEALGVLDETLVLVSSDVGATAARPVRGAHACDAGGRASLRRWRRGRRSRRVVTHTDTTATLLDLAGARCRSHWLDLDGASWRAEAAGAGAPPTTVPKVMESELERAVVMQGGGSTSTTGATSTGRAGAVRPGH